ANAFPPALQTQISDSGSGTSIASPGIVDASVTVSSFADPTQSFIPVAGQQTSYYQENLPSPVSPGNQLTLHFQVNGSAAIFGCLKVYITVVSDDPSQPGLFDSTGIPCYPFPPQAQNISQTVTTSPVMIGPSGTYSIFIQAIAQQDAPGTSN